MKWQVIDPAALHTRTWGDEVVVYDAASGNTHLLDTVAARVLATVTNAPADASAIAQNLADIWLEVPSEQAHEEIDAILAGLANTALITPVSP